MVLFESYYANQTYNPTLAESFEIGEEYLLSDDEFYDQFFESLIIGQRIQFVSVKHGKLLDDPQAIEDLPMFDAEVVQPAIIEGLIRITGQAPLGSWMRSAELTTDDDFETIWDKVRMATQTIIDDLISQLDRDGPVWWFSKGSLAFKGLYTPRAVAVFRVRDEIRGLLLYGHYDRSYLLRINTNK